MHRLPPGSCWLRGPPNVLATFQNDLSSSPSGEAAVGEPEKRAPSSANGAPDSSQVDGENKTSTPLTNKNDVGV